MLHGTGGNEHDLVSLASELLKGAGVLSPRGKVLERGMPRFFRRLSEGVFDIEDLRQRTAELADFVAEASEHYRFDASRVIAVGFSNGANIAASLVLLRPGVLDRAVLFRAMVPLVPDPLPRVPSTSVLISNGRVDPLVPAAETERLAELLRAADASVTVIWQQAGHQLVHDDIVKAREWLEHEGPRRDEGP
jgi:phospholipase/carboxylesterase